MSDSETNSLMKVAILATRTLNHSINKYVIRMMKDGGLKTTNLSVKIARRNCFLKEHEIGQLLNNLEGEGETHFSEREASSTTFREYLFSSTATWYWTTVGIAVAATVVALVVPEDAYPIVYVRNLLGAVFVLCLPGYALMKALFPTSAQTGKSSGGFDSIERIALSIGMSIAIVPIIALLLNYTPWGIRLLPLLLSLFAATVALATVAIIREYQT